jgi:SynChlorMet cassette radical SAM/SPASM protein ScmF
MRQCRVVIGLNGPDATSHDAICQDPGSFEAASEAIRLLATAGLGPQVVTTIMRGNVQRLPAILQTAERLGAASLRMVMVNTRLTQINAARDGDLSNQESRDREGLTVEELIALGRRVERDLSQTTRMQLLFEQPPAFRGLHSSSRVTGQSRCHIFNSLSVLTSGEYGLCGVTGQAPALTFGKVGEVPLEQIWNENPTLRAIRQGMPDKLEGVCGHCILKTACLGNCAVENYLSTGAFWGPYWFCDAAAQRGLFPAGRIIENVW